MPTKPTSAGSVTRPKPSQAEADMLRAMSALLAEARHCTEDRRPARAHAMNVLALKLNSLVAAYRRVPGCDPK